MNTNSMWARCALWTQILLWMLASGTAAATDIVAKLPFYPDGDDTREWQLVDSRYGYVAQYSLALADALDSCKAETSVAALLRIAPQRVTRATADALRKLVVCPEQLLQPEIDACRLG